MIITNESNADYHKNPAVSSSMAKLALESMQLYRDHQAGLVERKETPSMMLGTAIHAAVLEPELFKSDFIVKPDDMSFATKEGKQWKADNADKNILTPKDAFTVKMVIERMPLEISSLFDAAQKELTIRVDNVQCRFDALNGLDAIDLKSIDNIANIHKAITNYNYAFSAGWYNMVHFMDTGKYLLSWAWIFVETSAPWRWARYDMPLWHLNTFTEIAQETLAKIQDDEPDEPYIHAEWEPRPWDLEKIGMGDNFTLNPEGGIDL